MVTRNVISNANLWVAFEPLLFHNQGILFHYLFADCMILYLVLKFALMWAIERWKCVHFTLFALIDTGFVTLVLLFD